MNEEQPTQALATRPPAPRLTNLSLPEIVTLGRVLADSHMVSNVTTAAQAVAKIVYGQELGIGPMAALRGIHFIDGNLSPSATTLAGLIQNSERYSYRVLEWNSQVCRIAFFDRGESLGPPAEYTIEEARRVQVKGLPMTNKDNWKNYPKAMLFARAMGQGARAYCPGLLGGAPLYTSEELTDAPAPGVDLETGEIVEGSFTETPEVPPVSPEQKRALTQAFTARHWNGPQRAAWLDSHSLPGVVAMTEVQAAVALALLTTPEAEPTPIEDTPATEAA